MKHETIICKGSRIENQWDCDNQTAADVAGLDAIDPNAFYAVSWPDHVLVPKFNGDCSISAVSLPSVGYANRTTIHPCPLCGDDCSWTFEGGRWYFECNSCGSALGL